MAWEWSHTQEAYQNAFDNLESLESSVLNEIMAEIETWKHVRPDFDIKYYDDRLAHIKDTYTSELKLSSIWEFMEHYRTCDNGGFNAWCCPYGCHTVPFDKINESN